MRKSIILSLILVLLILISGCTGKIDSTKKEVVEKEQDKKIELNDEFIFIEWYNKYLSGIESDYKLNISEDELYFCEIDQDCTTVKPSCCGCGSGGTAISINKKYENEWNSYQRQVCMGTACASVMSQHITCFSQTKCENNRCTLIPNKENVCNSSLLLNCKAYTPEEQWNDVEREHWNNLQRSIGISCREVVELCK